MERLLESEKESIAAYYDARLSMLSHISLIFTPNEIERVNLLKREDIALIDPKVEKKHLSFKAENIDRLKAFRQFADRDTIDISSFIVNTGFDIKTAIKNKVFVKNSLHEGLVVLKNLTGIFVDEDGQSEDIKDILTGFAFDKDKYDIKAKKYGNNNYLKFIDEALLASIDLDDSIDKASEFYQRIMHNKNMKLAIKINQYQLANGIFRLQEQALPIDMDLCEKVFNKLKQQKLTESKMSKEMELELRNRARDLVWDDTIKGDYEPLIKTSRTITDFNKYAHEFEDKYHFPLQYFNKIEDGLIKYEWRTDRKDLLLLDNRQMENGKILTLVDQMKRNR